MRQARAKIAAPADDTGPVVDSPMPLFYKAPAILRFSAFGQARLAALGDYGFASRTAAIPMTAAEFAWAGADYPIVFSQGDGMPLAVVGVKAGQNLFAAEWTSDLRARAGEVYRRQYVPAYVRRYPFIAADSGEGSDVVLAIDKACDRLGPTKGEALFEVSGTASAVTRRFMALCHDYHTDHRRTQAFVAALQAEKLLVPGTMSLQIAGQSHGLVDGFHIVDEAAFQALPAETLAIWHRKQWLALVILHLASQRNWSALVECHVVDRQTLDESGVQEGRFSTGAGPGGPA